MKPVYLVCVTSNNNNKYYKMIPNGNTWTAEYGRVGYAAQTATYPMSDWNKKYNEKLKKGYRDQSELIEDLIESKSVSDTTSNIENAAIAEIVRRLQRMAKQAISDNYTISDAKVTQAMVDKADEIIEQLVNEMNLQSFNSLLMALFRTIPRKMKHVPDYLANTINDFEKIIKREQDLLDIMRGQVYQKSIETSETTETTQDSILTTLGLEFAECTADDIALIKSQLGSCKDRFYKAWRVTNKATQAKFDKFCADNKINNTKLLFHGSRNENWWSIIGTGLKLRPNNAVITGKMFGYGIYYAPKAQKSLGYTSLSGSYWARGNSSSGFMALMDVAYGKPYNVYSFDSKYNSFNYQKLRAACPNADCLHAHAGSMLRNDEIVVYNEEQCTIKYLIELK